MSAIFGSSAKAGTPAAPAENSRGQAGHRVAVKLAVRDQRAVRGTCRRYCRDCQPAVLDVLAKKNKQKLNWRPSIVDLTKLLDLDSNQAARKKLADELHYSGDTRTPPR